MEACRDVACDCAVDVRKLPSSNEQPAAPLLSLLKLGAGVRGRAAATHLSVWPKRMMIQVS